MADERHKSLLVTVLQGVANGVNAISRSPAFAALVEAEVEWRGKREPFYPPSNEVYIKDDGVVRVEGFEEPIDLTKLRRTIGNLAASLSKVNVWARMPEGNAPIRRATALNYLARSAASAEMLAVLLKSDEVYSPFQEAARRGAKVMQGLDPDEEITGRSREDILVVNIEDGDQEIALDLGAAYQSLKKIGGLCTNAKMYVTGGGDAEKLLDQIYQETLKARERISDNPRTTTIKRDQHG